MIAPGGRACIAGPHQSVEIIVTEGLAVGLGAIGGGGNCGVQVDDIADIVICARLAPEGRARTGGCAGQRALMPS
ncbi:hypothetical protein [Dictyobacter kobayashii]|uniref:Uncharacterized protein n=1 Tax=Dictyobacter kobayashii TaxID=2014872 RepID=A0A402AVS1_9CHLR|nr:hypothetical protein [Dictyobacter kobayashii]GCE23179.1 hypothetical protein KDK_69790 [Dictyobacter kobayashii]